MAKGAIVVLADTESREGLGRLVNALTTAKEFAESGDEVSIVFDGAGTKWIPALEAEEHKYHGLYASVRDRIAGACDYCAGAYGVKAEVEAAGVTLLDEYAQHPSIRRFVAGGYAVITF
jgi:hypothetical protein